MRKDAEFGSELTWLAKNMRYLLDIFSYFLWRLEGFFVMKPCNENSLSLKIMWFSSPNVCLLPSFVTTDATVLYGFYWDMHVLIHTTLQRTADNV